MKTDTTTPAGFTRRDFVKTSATAALGVSAGLMATSDYAYAAGSDTLRVGLVGCGGRGTGAARDAVQAAEGVEVVAMGDLFEDRLKKSKEQLQEAIGDALKVTQETSLRWLRRLPKSHRQRRRLRHPRHAARLPPDACPGRR